MSEVKKEVSEKTDRLIRKCKHDWRCFYVEKQGTLYIWAYFHCIKCLEKTKKRYDQE